MDLTPSLVLAMWTCGIAAGAALVGWWRVVGTGYLWLAGSIVVVFSVLTGLAGGGTAAYIGATLAVFATIVAHFRIGSTILFAAAAIMNGVAGAMDSPVMAVISGSLLLGAITSEMLLGHWFLVDPRLPRWSLVRLELSTEDTALQEALDQARHDLQSVTRAQQVAVVARPSPGLEIAAAGGAIQVALLR